MAKKNIITFSIIFVAIATAAILLVFIDRDEKSIGQEVTEDSLISGPVDIATITNKQILSLLKTNSDSAGYVNKYKDFEITSEIPLTKEAIEVGRQGENFKEVYQGLELQDNRYMRVI